MKKTISYIITISLLLFFTGVSPAYANETINFSATQDGWDNLAADSQRYIARSFVPSGNVDSLTVSFGGKALLSPNGNLVIGVMADSSGNPSETYLSSITMSAAVLGTNGSGCNDKTTSSITVSLTSGTTYWLVYGRDGNYSTGYYQICDKGGLSGTPLKFKNYGTGNWNAISTADLYGSIALVGAVSIVSPILSFFNWNMW